MTEAIVRKRPKHLAVWKIHMPIPAIVSIVHRVTGAGLFLLLPFLICLLGMSLESESSFDAFKAVVANPFVKIVLLGLLWAYLHHFCAGIRYLMMDIGKGDGLCCARRSAVAVVVVSLTLTAVIGVILW